MIEEVIRNLVLDMGGTFAGFSNLTGKLPEALREYPFAVTVGVHLSEAVIGEIIDKPTFTYFNHYRSVNFLIDQILLRVLLFLQDRGYGAYTIAASQSIPGAVLPYSGVFPHKTGAVAAGLGWIGKNGLFISREYGPAVRLGTVLTDCPFELHGKMVAGKSAGQPVGGVSVESEAMPDDTVRTTAIPDDAVRTAAVPDDAEALNHCGNCRRCVDSCPAGALTGHPWNEGTGRDAIVDAKACSDYMNAHFKHIGRGSVCGICIRVCPFRKVRGRAY